MTTAPSPEEVAFMHEGSCKGEDTTIFYPSLIPTPAEKHKSLRAKAICQICPVKEECLEYSLLRELFGIWGGLDEKERFYLRRERKMDVIAYERELLPGVRTGYRRKEKNGQL